MHKICNYIDFNMQNLQNICTTYADIYKKMQIICTNMLKICIKSASNMHQICSYIDFNMQNKQNKNMCTYGKKIRRK